jgi:acetyl esterase/lipase
MMEKGGAMRVRERARGATVPLCLLFLLVFGAAADAGGIVIYEMDLAYRQGPDYTLRLNLCRPEGEEGPYPALVYLVGGAWGYSTVERRGYMNAQIGKAAARGYVAVTVDTRPVRGTAAARFPAQLQDARCAVEWLRANAARLAIDPDRIGLVGDATGAQVALLLGLTRETDGLEEGGDFRAVQAVVATTAATELAGLYREVNTFKGILAVLLGGTPEQVPEGYRRASPLTWARAGGPPILLVHGERDTIIPPGQSRQMAAALENAGAAVRLVVRADGTHDVLLVDDPVVFEFLDSVLGVSP